MLNLEIFLEILNKVMACLWPWYVQSPQNILTFTIYIITITILILTVFRVLSMLACQVWYEQRGFDLVWKFLVKQMEFWIVYQHSGSKYLALLDLHCHQLITPENIIL